MVHAEIIPDGDRERILISQGKGFPVPVHQGKGQSHPFFPGQDPVIGEAGPDGPFRKMVGRPVHQGREQVLILPDVPFCTVLQHEEGIECRVGRRCLLYFDAAGYPDRFGPGIHHIPVIDLENRSGFGLDRRRTKDVSSLFFR